MHGVRITCAANLADGWGVISHVGRMEQHGGMAGIVWRVGDRRGGNQRAMLLEETA